MKKTITLVFMILLVALSIKLKAQQPQMQPQQQQLPDTITYWMDYNWDNLDANDFDTIWNIRCFIQVPAGVSMKNFHLKLDDVLNNVNNLCNTNSPDVTTITSGVIASPCYLTPHPKRTETSYVPTFTKSGNYIVADLGFHRSHYFNVEVKPKDLSNNLISKVKKLKDIKY